MLGENTDVECVSSVLTISFRNTTNLKIPKNNIKIGVVVDREDVSSKVGEIIPQPDGTNLIVIKYKDELYPDEWGKADVLTWPRDDEAITIRIFLPNRSFDFPVKIKREIMLIPDWLTDDEG